MGVSASSADFVALGAEMRRLDWRAVTVAWTAVVLVAACFASTTERPASTLSSNNPNAASSPSTAQTPRGAQVRVQLEGASACDGGYFCTGRLTVLPGGPRSDPGASLVSSDTDPMWQSDWNSGANMVPPPDGDLPVLPAGSYVVVWSVMAQPIATDPPTAPALLASQCSVPLDVSTEAGTATLRVHFTVGGTLAPGSARCTIRLVGDGAATPVPTPGTVSGVERTPRAALPTAWRRVSPGDLTGLGDPGFVVALGVAPDGAFIAIPGGNDRASLSVLRSVDGETWSKVAVLPSSKNGWAHALATDGNVIVVTGGAGGAARIWRSFDGIHWTVVDEAGTNGLQAVDAIAANSVGFVATHAGATGVAPWIGSADGSTWQRAGSLTSTQDAAIVDVTASGTGFVAVGRTGDVDGPAAAWVSSGGRSWEPATVAGGAGVTLVSVAATGERLIAFGQGSDPRRDPLEFASDDGGRSWAPVSGGSRPGSSWPPVQAVAGGFVATSYGVWTSRDGVDWDDAAWTSSAGAVPTDGVPSVTANDTRVLVAMMSRAGGYPIFWIGEKSSP